MAVVAMDVGFFDFTYGLINKTGKEITPLKYSDIYSFREDMAVVQDQSGKYGYMDKTGKEVTLQKYDNAWAFRDGLAKVRLNDKYGFVDKTGKEVIEIKYGDIPPTDYTETTDYNYDTTTSFKEGLAVVRVGEWVEDEWWAHFEGKSGYIDKSGNMVLNPVYDYASYFSEGLAVVRFNGKWGIITP